MKTIRLYGELGEKYGRVHRLDVRTTGEALRALSAIRKGFQKDLMTAEKRGIGYRVKNGNHDLKHENEVSDPASRTIKIIPTLIGSGSPGTKILIGAILIAAAIAITVLSAGTGAPLSAQIIGGVGASLLLGGVSQLLAPQPPNQEGPGGSADNQPSYNFNGPVNTSAQGHPVSVGYGKLLIGSAVISAGITLEQIKQGFKRIKSEQTTDVNVYNFTNTPSSGGEIPANWFKKDYLQDNFDGTTEYRYHYFVWSVVPI